MADTAQIKCKLCNQDTRAENVVIDHTCRDCYYDVNYVAIKRYHCEVKKMLKAHRNQESWV